ncbi:MAG TPA: hypothetical protein VGO52_17495 [Hyphomonadaceae bacterium]|nr:hypothetical protein [Hyphomonadaceae bacterium]
MLLLPVLFESAIAQTPAAPASLPRTAEGHPDLQGVWEFRWRTLLTRPPGAPVSLPPAGVGPFIERQLEVFRALPGNGNPESDTDLTTLVRVHGEYRTSLIVEPADGQIPWLPGRQPPPLTPALMDAIVTDPEQRAPNERCIATESFPMIPIPTNNYVQIVQPPGAVVMMPEALGHVRRLAPGAVRQASPDVLSRWEGDALVVESRNFTPDMRFTQPGTLVGFSPASSVVETFTPVSADEIFYRFTVTDTTLYSRPWTVETTWIRSDHSLFEYACHEGNYALTNILLGGRVREVRKAPR